MRVYVASSWRNEQQQNIVARLREVGHEVYDFKHPRGAGSSGFAWRDIDPAWERWTAQQQIAAYDHTLATHGLGADLAGMVTCDALVMVQPCGRSAALELGWAIGARKMTIVLMADGQEPELMLRLADHLVTSLDEVIELLA